MRIGPVLAKVVQMHKRRETRQPEPNLVTSNRAYGEIIGRSTTNGNQILLG
jgi:hypothetical protein